MNDNRPGLSNLHAIGATVFYTYSQGDAAEKRLRITDLSFQYGKKHFTVRFETRRGTVFCRNYVPFMYINKQ